NVSDHPLPVISKFNALEFVLGESVLHGNCIVSSTGGVFDSNFPPDSFSIRQRLFSPIFDEFSAICSAIELATEGGRSSSKDLPFFLLQNKAKSSGMFVGFGWSGQWSAKIWLDPKLKTVSVIGKIPGLEISLQPGEEIQGPNVLVGLYDGSISDGFNRLRNVLREFYTPKLA